MSKPVSKKNSPKKSNTKRSLSVTKTEVYPRSIPPPDMMEGYRTLDSSFPNRILTIGFDNMIERTRNILDKMP